MMHTTGRTPIVVLAALALTASAGCGERTIPLPSGVKYADLTFGQGVEAKPGDFVEVHYTGSLQSDDTCFESGESKDLPLFRLGSGAAETRGLDEGIVGMKPGGKRKIYVPPALGYADKGRGYLVPPNADLVYEVELRRILAGFKTEDLQDGVEPVAKWNDEVQIRYTGWIKDQGVPFESNLKQEKPFTFRIGQHQAIRGMEAGVVGMQVGSKRRITIPAELAYGNAGNAPAIPPDSDLVFEVVLEGIVK
jgi:FKBP-type peptidyl-prolyl cis-trans isomerase